MDSIDLDLLRRRTRLAYEMGRLRLALLGVLPVFLLIFAALLFSHRRDSTLWLGVASVTVGFLMLFYGREPQRAVLPGIAAGAVPLALALCANNLHACGSHGCSSLCVPACIVGGAVAGLAVATIGNHRKAGVWFWLPASGLAVLIGAMGCACIGYSGVVGLAAGFAAGMAPGLLRKLVGKKS